MYIIHVIIMMIIIIILPKQINIAPYSDIVQVSCFKLFMIYITLLEVYQFIPGLMIPTLF